MSSRSNIWDIRCIYFLGGVTLYNTSAYMSHDLIAYDGDDIDRRWLLRVKYCKLSTYYAYDKYSSVIYIILCRTYMIIF